MGLISKTINRSNAGTVRKEDDRAKMIEDFFAGQKDVVRYEITDSKEWVVIVEGSIHLHESDIDNGELFFKLGKLTGNLYCHCKHLKQSVIPNELGGEIVFVPNEEELWKNNGTNADIESALSMGFNVKKDPTAESLERDLMKVLRDSISFGIPLDIDKIKAEVETQINEEIKKEYGLRLVLIPGRVEPNRKETIGEYKIYVTNEDKPLKLEASQKAFYLTYLLYENGLKLVQAEMSDEFKSIMQKIYRQLPHTSYNRKNLLDKDGYDSWSISRINPMRTHIMKEINRIILNTKIAKEFCIEMADNVVNDVQQANEIYLIARSTPEIRAQIRKDFKLE